MAGEAISLPPASAALQADSKARDVHPSQKELQNALYARCVNVGADAVFTQQDLLAFGIIPDEDLELLLRCINQLMKEGLFKVLKKDSAICWKVVKKEDADKYKILSEDENIVYSYIESSAREGIWTRTIKAKANIHMSVVNKCLKSLEQKKYIKATRNVKFPTRKYYMLHHLQPSEATTGGPFYTDGTLDEEFVHQMAAWTERFIVGKSWSHRPLPETLKKKNLDNLTREQAEKLRAEEMTRGNVCRERTKDMLPMPPGFTGYPTLSEITKAVNASGLSGVIMKEAEMLQLLNILIWDAKIERVPGIKGYRAIRQVPGSDVTGLDNALTEAPCGRCPVIEVCEDGGPVNATTCEYFEDWLNVL